MILVENIGKNTLFIPKNEKIDGTFSLILKGTVTNETYTFNGLEDLSSFADYYKVEIDFTDIPEGEYEYFLPNEFGLLRLGILKPNKISYEAEKTIIAYEG